MIFVQFLFFFSFQAIFSSMLFLFDVMSYLIYIVCSYGILEKSNRFSKKVKF